MACRLFGAKPLMTFSEVDTQKHISVKFGSKYNTLHLGFDKCFDEYLHICQCVIVTQMRYVTIIHSRLNKISCAAGWQFSSLVFCLVEMNFYCNISRHNISYSVWQYSMINVQRREWKSFASVGQPISEEERKREQSESEYEKREWGKEGEREWLGVGMGVGVGVCGRDGRKKVGS